MNGMINFVLKNKYAVWLLTLIITVAGLYSGMNMKLETIPNINVPMISVTTVYPGATPQAVADEVSKPIEQAIQNLNGVSVVNSSSFQNASSIQIEYKYEKNMDEAEDELNKVLANLSFPEGAKDPDIARMSMNAFPILAASVANDKQSLSELSKTMEKEIVPALEGLNGVASVQISGQLVNEAELVFYKDKMAQYGLSEDTVQNIIKGSNVAVPLGLYTFGNSEKSVVVDGKMITIANLKSMEIPVMPSASAQAAQGSGSEQGTAGAQGASGMSGVPTGAGTPVTTGTPQTAPGNQSATGTQSAPGTQSIGLPTVKLGDIADIKVVGKAETISRTNGKDAIGIQIIKASDANTVTVANAVKDKLADFEDKMKGLDVNTTFDQAKPIEQSVSTMLSKAIFGAIFAVLIIMLFLRNFKSTLISVVSIPLSLLIGILLLKQMDITLNMMTLGAMTVAIGRVVDDSIVVIENIFRRMSLSGEKLKGKALVREATKEMFMPILSSTLVTIAVFLPMALVKGMIGELFMPFALTIVFSLLASLLVAITIVPMLAHSLFKKNLAQKVHHEEGKPSKLAGVYKSVLNWALNHKAITSSIAILMLVGSFFLVSIIGVSFLPADENKMIIATYKPAPGETLSEVEQLTTKAESYFMDRKDAKTVQFSLGGQNPMNPGSGKDAMFFVNYKDDTKNFEKEKETVIKDLNKMTKKGEWGSQDFSASAGSNEIVVHVYGDDLKEIEPIVKEIEDKMNSTKNFKDVKSSIAETYDEYVLVVDQAKVSKLGLTAGQIGMGLMPNMQRPVLTTVEKDGEGLNVYLQVEKEAISSISDLTSKKIKSPLGFEVPVSELVKVKEGKTSNTITRRDGRISVQVSGKPKTDDVSKASKDLQVKMDKIDHPDSIEISMGGVTEDINSAFTQLGLAMLAAIAIVYLILVITFGGGLAPLAILFSLPFTIIGGLVALLIAGETLSVSSLIGALMLIGIVVTNAIVLIDRVIHKEREGYSTREALLEAGSTRLRPILMTAIATIGALLPLAFGMEGSGLISKGMGVTVIGGLTSSTLLTLLIVPIVYELLSKFKKKPVQGEE
ncbi:efflux RND transporter permease subunit [Bacillus sp. 1NLA3E]|uniref:efflux RND transporter permease subunit n=1 Tax=Bacillus sp. 1NLA3E TaxID=666686 RepID=UPI000247EE45|nr:efflux RND transporter permease subunit [Bacillus sp. 1NLA3E]AGK55632.1 transporter AcrB/AcrD/AcrF family protein [Bacillus sp. 1NLA3E]